MIFLDIDYNDSSKVVILAAFVGVRAKWKCRMVAAVIEIVMRIVIDHEAQGVIVVATMIAIEFVVIRGNLFWEESNGY